MKWDVKDEYIKITAKGKLTDTDYKEALPLLDSIIKERDYPKFLIILDDFKGWDSAALWTELKYDLQHGAEFGPIAIVGDDSTVQKWSARLSDIFLPSEVKYFTQEGEDDAERWLRFKDVQSEYRQTGT